MIVALRAFQPHSEKQAACRSSDILRFGLTGRVEDLGRAAIVLLERKRQEVSLSNS
jgi:hypothetical protein